ncbi:TIGR02996 domain-containing protein [Telmatocola sphagniphila]|uniref:TIGR02996 domain-containing protein n=1 Tax=Telmatocola sphagniphila TaxID=1123043 RepID=A0A8E6B4G5_9BACT|nr:TIGR02996 domain-containing protein [Telmatocola sphagniphila]QVL30200.1 TIGR02996 domain-containing protein [Telmatocola sphagniphila]
MNPTQQEIDRAAFIRKICESPFDPTPRLIYADWLEDIGQEGQAILVRRSVPGPARGVLILSIEEKVFVNPKAKGVFDSIKFDVPTFFANAQEIFLKFPIIEVSIKGKKPQKARQNEYWVWVSDQFSNHRLINSNSVPQRFIDLMCHQPNRTGIAFHTCREAIDALSRACVDYGREQAGLPAIDWEKLA